jgi:mRNA-degrading endonuclease YafQ of YafQ-DinJ toxin-antitoxin module
MDMTHRFGVGINVYFEPRFGDAAARGKYKIVRQLPIENDNRLAYRIKSLAESFERIAEEHQLRRGG